MALEVKECPACKTELEHEITDHIIMSIIHEIRNPLTIISGFSKKISEKIELGEPKNSQICFSRKDVDKIMNYTGIIVREMKRLDKILNTAYDFVSHKNLDLEKVDITKLFEEILDMENDSQIEIITNFYLAKKVIVDPAKIKMLILNLMINAKEAIMESKNNEKGRIKITVAPKCPENKFFFRISNNGIPIPKENLKRIFNPFFTTKGRDSGVGLSTAKAIVKAHNGEIRVKSMGTPQGTTFMVSLPICPN
jgi:signal transduction histidine kinase